MMVYTVMQSFIHTFPIELEHVSVNIWQYIKNKQQRARLYNILQL